MVRTLQRHGNSMALVFDKTMLEALNITPDTPLVITISGGQLTITPANVGIPDAEMDAMLERLGEKYATMLENLAK